MPRRAPRGRRPLRTQRSRPWEEPRSRLKGVFGSHKHQHKSDVQTALRQEFSSLAPCAARSLLGNSPAFREQAEKQLFRVKNNYILSSSVASAKYLLI